jgi:glycosyltransferase involved in cell wall biosynthesis
MKASLPKVSVIIAAYNVAEYIGETLASVFAQSFSDYEVIVVDDGSEDEVELAKALAPFRERIVYLRQENRGVAGARNTGIGAARGEFVAFLDADDLWEPEFLREQIDFVEHDEYDLAYTDALLFGDSEYAGRTFMDVAPSAGEVNFASLIAADCNVIGSAVVARRQSLIEAGLFDENLRNAQDFDLWIRMSLRGARMGYQKKALARYRYREGSLSGDAVNRVNRELRVYRKVLAQYDLDANQRGQVERAIQRLDRELNLVLGKEHLNRREFDEALECFHKAKAIQSNWKLRASCALLSFAPGVLTALNSFLNRRRAKRAGRILRNTP